MTIDILKVIDEVDRYLFRRMDLTEAELKVVSAIGIVNLAASSLYMVCSIAKFRRLRQEIEKLKNAKGE